MLPSQRAEITVVELSGKGYVFSEPGGRNKGIGIFFCRKFNFQKDQMRKPAFKYIQFSGQSAGKRDHVTLLLNQMSVYFGQKVIIGFPGQREIIFLPCHGAFGFVSDFILIVIPPDADDGLCIQISLLYDAAGVFL